MQFKTLLHAAVPRVKCPEHGVKQVSVPWSEKGSRFTLLFERFAIDVLLATQTVSGAMSILQTNWDQTWNVIKRAVQRGQLRKKAKPMPRIGIDEKAFAKGQSYITLLYDLDNSTVEAISDGNNTESGNACFSQLSSDQLESVEAVAMDMSAAFVKAAKQSIPLAEAKIVHDRFHVMQLATSAVDKVRRGEHRQLKHDGDNRLARTKYIWIKSQENLTDKQRELFDEVFHQQLETGKAWGYKEMLRDLWHHDDAATATVYFNQWYRSVIHTKLTPMKNVAKTIKERLANVVSYCTPWDHQRSGRGNQQQDHGDQATCGRLPKSRQLQDCDLLLLRWTQSLPTLNPDGPFFDTSNRCGTTLRSAPPPRRTQTLWARRAIDATSFTNGGGEPARVSPDSHP